MQGEVKLQILRYDCIESPFTWEIMAAHDIKAIDKLLEKPPTPPDDLTSAFSGGIGKNDGDKNAGGRDSTAGGNGDVDSELGDSKPMNPLGGRLLDLSRMLDMKKRQQEAKKKKVENLLEKQRAMIPYNPLLSKETIENRVKDIQTYKNKIS
jgi:hypothetical protein